MGLQRPDSGHLHPPANTSLPLHVDHFPPPTSGGPPNKVFETFVRAHQRVAANHDGSRHSRSYLNRFVTQSAIMIILITKHLVNIMYVVEYENIPSEYYKTQFT